MVGQAKRFSEEIAQELVPAAGAGRVAPAAIATGVGAWATSTTNARAPVSIQGIEPLQIMLNAKGLATAESYDHGFVFH
jgi:hypothetical protein